MADNALVIPVTFRVGATFPPYLPLSGGEMKATTDCTRAEIGEAVAELRNVAQVSRERLQLVYEEHVRDVEMLAQVAAYLEKYDEWEPLRRGGKVREVLWHAEDHG